VANDAALADASARREEAAGRQSRLEHDLAAVEAKVADVERRLYSGAITIPRELQAMQTDRDLLRRRQSMLEDEVLEAMGEWEPIDAEVDTYEAERLRLDEEGSRLRAAIAEGQVAIDSELSDEATKRSEAAAGLPPDLTSLYERLRAQHGGVAAAPLIGGRCNGCYLALPATEVDRIKREPPDALVTCDQCGRILVRP